MSIKQITDAEFKNELEQNDLVIVKYYADWCGSCKLIAPKYRRLSDNEKYSNVAFFDVNAEENPEARNWAGVSNLPFFAVAKKGKLVKGDFTSKIEVVEDLLNEITS